jgi:hypothetical protein
VPTWKSSTAIRSAAGLSKVRTPARIWARVSGQRLLLYLSELVDRDGRIQHRKIESLVVDDCAEPAPCEIWQFTNDLLRFKTASGEPPHP